MKKLLLIMLVCGTAFFPQSALAKEAPEAVSSTQNNQQATLIDYEIINPEMRYTEFFDDFDDLVPGLQLVMQGADGWDTWSGGGGGGEDPLVSGTYSYSSPNSVVIASGNDLVHLYGSLTEGSWSTSFQAYIPTGQSGYFNMMYGFTPNPFDWAMEIYFDAGGSGRLLADTQINFSWTADTWQSVEVIVDLDQDLAQFNLDGTVLHQWNYSQGGGTVRLDANDFFGAASTDEMYFDNYTVAEVVESSTDPFFSEYIEGSSYNKALEIYNGTGADIDLSAYSLSSCSNGCDTDNEWDYPDNVTFAEGTIVAAGDVYVVYHQDADAAIAAEGDQTFTYLSNGDDAFAITLAGATASSYTIIDIIGDMGGDPGNGWEVAGVADGTQNHTLVRKAPVASGNGGDWASSAGTDADDSEWIVYDSNTFDYLGFHPHEGEGPSIEITSPSEGATVYTPDVTVEFDVQNFNVGTSGNEGVDGHIHYQYVGGDAGMHYSGDPIELTDLTDGEYTLSLWLVDNSHQPLDPNVSDTVNFIVEVLSGVVSIYDIQYVEDPATDDASPLVDQEVTIFGTVTAEFWGGSSNYNVYVQDAEAPWSGIVVYEAGGWDNFDINSPEGIVHSVAEGDSVTITGTVVEYYNKTEIIDVTSFNIITHGSLGVNPLEVTCAELTDNAEAYEGVLVGISDCSVDDPDLGYGEWSVTDGTGSARLDDNWQYYYWPEAGQELAEVVGVLDYAYGDFKIQPRLARDIVEGEGDPIRIQRIQQVLYSDLIKAGEDEVSDMSYMYGDTVTLEGIVTMPTGLSYAGDGIKFIYEDEHGGPWSAVLSYDPDSSAFPVLYEGDLVQATGYIYEYVTSPANMTELFITEPIDIIDVGLDQPVVDTVATGDLRWPTKAEQWGNVMVRVADVTVIDSDLPYGEWSVDDGSGSVNIDDDSDSIAVWQEENGRPPAGTFIQSIRGWVYHHYGSNVDSTAYKLEPLYMSDIEFGSGPPNIQDVGRAPCVPGPGDGVVVSCEISDNSGVASAEITYSVDGDNGTAAMSNTGGTTWEGTIPATGVDGANVDYYIVATDDGEDQNESLSSTYPADITQLQLGYTTQSGDLAISNIQFTDWPAGDSPYNGCEVTVTGIVTGDTSQYYSFYFQDTYTIQSADDPWNGVIIAGWGGSQLTRGEEVTITGTVEEYDNADPYGHYQWDNNTKIIGVSDVVVQSSGNSVAPMQVSTADLAQDGEEVESYEGCLVTLTNVTVSDTGSYDWSVVDESGVACLIDDDMADEAADAFLGTLEIGQSLSSVTGIFVFSFGTYKLEVRDMADLGEVGIGDNVDLQPYTYKLYPNFPNPFNPETRIRFDIPESERVKVIIYDILGHHVRTLTNRDYDRGYHVLNWDGRNDAGALVSSGVYVCRIKAGEFIDHNKMTLVR